MSSNSAAQGSAVISNLVGCSFGILFTVIGLLNLFLVHPVPGVFYLLLSLIYWPRTNVLFKRRLGFSIPLSVKVILGIVILWGTLAVGDLAEMYGL